MVPNKPIRTARGGKSKFRIDRRKEKSTTAVLCEGTAKPNGVSYSPAMYDCFEGDETKEDHIIPRRSLTAKLHLRAFPQEIERERLKDTVRYQPNKRSKTGKLMQTTDPRYRTTWKSDRSLLNQRKPEQLEDIRFTRETHYTKRRIAEREQPAVIEIPTDISDDIDL